MQKKIARGAFIFRRDFRIEDNLALLRATSECGLVACCFVFNPEQVLSSQNRYFNNKTVQFLCECLDDLDSALRSRGSRLFLLFGSHEDAFFKITSEMQCTAIFENFDITPYAVRRKGELQALAAQAGVRYECSDQDYSLLHSDSYLVKSKKGCYYKSFTDYYRNVVKVPVAKPQVNQSSNFLPTSFRFACQFKGQKSDFYMNQDGLLRGGRKQALAMLKSLASQKEYAKNRNFPEKSTTKIAPYLKYGCLSIREFYNILQVTLGPEHDLVRQVYWRDYFYHLTFHFPHIEKQNFHRKFDEVRWADPGLPFELWKEGRTGCPLVDAGMRQLKLEGWMPNVMRLLTANFLIKNLFIDWRLGEQHFARELIDYDWGINNGSWQFVAGTGKVQQPYYLLIDCFKSQKFDRECAYIKRWVVELAAVPAEDVHAWPAKWEEYGWTDYPRPIVEHEESGRRFLEAWQQFEEEEEEEMVDLEDLGKKIVLEEFDMQYAFI